jgi:hypothetical protein
MGCTKKGLHPTDKIPKSSNKAKQLVAAIIANAPGIDPFLFLVLIVDHDTFEHHYPSAKMIRSKTASCSQISCLPTDQHLLGSCLSFPFKADNVFTGRVRRSIDL